VVAFLARREAAVESKDDAMKAMVLSQPGRPLAERDLPVPRPGPGQLLLKVLACGVCRTDLHVVDGELEAPRLPLIPGHEIVARVEALGEGVRGVAVGERMGVPWLGHACGHCRYCRDDRENLCDEPGFTGYQIDGGYADYTVADADFCFPIPAIYGDVEAAPLLCAGLIGFRSYRMAGEGRRLGLYGFGAAAHILAQVARHDGREVYAFTRPGDQAAQDFARRMGAVWAGGSDEAPPVELEAAIIFAPAGALVPAALRAVRKGGRVICGGIHMSDIPGFPYGLLWEERSVASVANLTRRDGRDFMALAGRFRIETHTHAYPLSQANQALDDLRAGRFTGAAVLVP
jgi:propanol-preferring alcohol dehydrogenase